MLKTDLESYKHTFEILNKLYFQYNLQNIDNILFIDSKNGELIPFLEIKHKKYNYKNIMHENDDILSMDIFKNIKKINCIKDIKEPHKYDLIIVNSVHTYKKYNTSLLDITGYIIYIGNEQIDETLGLVQICKDSNIVMYRKMESFNRINRSNEFNGMIPLKNKITMQLVNNHTPNLDVHMLYYYIDQNTFKIHTVRFDDESISNTKLKIKIFSLDESSSEEIEFYQEGKTLDIRTCKTSIYVEPINNINKSYVIPKVICQTLENDIVGELHNRTILNLKLLNPEYKYQLFDAYDRRNFIKNFFDESVLDAYDGLVSGAFKADLFRYCWLYMNGGVYIDCKMINRVPLREIISSDEEYYLVKDRIPNAYQNCFIAVKSKDINILTCISEVVKRFQKKINIRESFGSLHHTGPYLFYDCMKKYETSAIFDSPFQCTDYKDSKLVSDKGKIIFNMWFKNYYLKYSMIHKGNKQWAEQWQNNEIYYSDKYKVSGLDDYIILIHPNQKSKNEIDNLQFQFKNNMIYNNKYDKLQCKLIDNSTNIERIIIVHKFVEKTIHL